MIWDWRDDIQVGDILFTRRGHPRVVRAVSRRKSGHLHCITLAIKRCSWTGRCYTVMNRHDIKHQGMSHSGCAIRGPQRGSEKEAISAWSAWFPERESPNPEPAKQPATAGEVEAVAEAIKSIPIKVVIKGDKLAVYHNDITARETAKAAIAALRSTGAKGEAVVRDRTQRRVVCAAIRNEDGRIVIGPRHFDRVMQRSLEMMGGQGWAMGEQGFIDQWGKFMAREDAFIVATAAGQILEKTGNQDSNELFSEDLY
jgi:hypothetical protein